MLAPQFLLIFPKYSSKFSKKILEIIKNFRQNFFRKYFLNFFEIFLENARTIHASIVAYEPATSADNTM